MQAHLKWSIFDADPRKLYAVLRHAPFRLTEGGAGSNFSPHDRQQAARLWDFLTGPQAKVTKKLRC